MRLCTNCLHHDDRKIEHCPSCGAEEFAKLNSKGYVTELPAGAGMPCQGCLEVGRPLKLRYYRHVVGMAFADRIYGTAGYFCASCRHRQFGKHLGLTLLLGWWGMIALWFRNPYAIVTNLWALAAPPFDAGRLGAMNVNEIRADAREQQRLADVYTSMPSWFEHIEEDEIELILTDRDYYTTLRIERTAGHHEIKTAWREQVKLHHPDTAGAGSHDRMVEINDAYKVLGDQRLRHAYDHQNELLAFLGELRDIDGDGEPDLAGYDYGCGLCRSAFPNFDEFADHVDAEHPHTDYQDALVELRDGVPVVIDDDREPTGSVGWRCKLCREVFDDYDAALAHADRAHPERVAIDVRTAVEPA
jgi:DnaJ-like protein